MSGQAAIRHSLSSTALDIVNGNTGRGALVDPGEFDTFARSLFDPASANSNVTDEGGVNAMVLTMARVCMLVTDCALFVGTLSQAYPTVGVRNAHAGQVSSTTFANHVSGNQNVAQITAPVILMTACVSVLLKRVMAWSWLALTASVILDLRDLLVKSPTSVNPQCLRFRSLFARGEFGQRDNNLRVYTTAQFALNAINTDVANDQTRSTVRLFSYGFSAGSSTAGNLIDNAADPGVVGNHQVEGFPLTYNPILHETVAIELPCVAGNATLFNATVPATRPGSLNDTRVETRAVGITGGTTVVKQAVQGQRAGVKKRRIEFAKK